MPIQDWVQTRAIKAPHFKAIVLACLTFITGLALTVTAMAQAPTATPASEPITIVALGDSLTAGYGLGPGQSFPEKLQAALQAQGKNVVVQNAGVSGDTSSAGLARLNWSVGDTADAVIVELGANDALRGIDPGITEQNLINIITQLRARGLPILLTGMRAPPNMGDEYTIAFDAIYPRLAASYDVVYYPFFLDGVAAEPSLNLDDGIHPNEAGIDVIVERIMPQVMSLIERAQDKKAISQ